MVEIDILSLMLELEAQPYAFVGFLEALDRQPVVPISDAPVDRKLSVPLYTKVILKL